MVWIALAIGIVLVTGIMVIFLKRKKANNVDPYEAYAPDNPGQEYLIICPNCGCDFRGYNDQEVRQLSGIPVRCHCKHIFTPEFIPMPVIDLGGKRAPNPCTKWGGPLEPLE